MWAALRRRWKNLSAAAALARPPRLALAHPKALMTHAGGMSDGPLPDPDPRLSDRGRRTGYRLEERDGVISDRGIVEACES